MDVLVLSIYSSITNILLRGTGSSPVRSILRRLFIPSESLFMRFLLHISYFYQAFILGFSRTSFNSFDFLNIVIEYSVQCFTKYNNNFVRIPNRYQVRGFTRSRSQIPPPGLCNKLLVYLKTPTQFPRFSFTNIGARKKSFVVMVNLTDVKISYLQYTK